MEDNVQKLNIQPKASVYDTFSNYSYKVWYSIAEFVDNSTSSFYKYERALKFYRQDQLRIDIEYDSVNHILRIIDNAYGMEIEDFKRAILLGSKPSDNTGRNEFGMGLKTAASWFGKWWSVSSTQLGSNNRYTAVVDIPKLYETDEIDIVTTKCPKEEHGTVIEIRNLTKKIEGGKTIGKIKEVLRSMYRRDLNSGKVKIFFKTEELTFRKYQILCSGDKEWRKNLDFYFSYDKVLHHVIGFVGILGEGSDHDEGSYAKAGFALFRRDRVIIGHEGEYYKPYEIFGQAQSRISLNMFGELDLDDFPVNQAKDGFVWDDGLESAFLDALKIQISDYMKLADKPKKQKSKPFDPSNKKELEATKQSTQASLNKLREVTEGEEAPVTNEGPKTAEEKEYEDAFVNVEDAVEKVYEESAATYKIPLGINEEIVNVTWSNAGGAYWYSFNKDNNEIKINIAHPFFQPFCSSAEFRDVLNKFVIAIYLAEKRAESTTQEEGYAYVEDINNEINNILKKLS